MQSSIRRTFVSVVSTVTMVVLTVVLAVWSTPQPVPANPEAATTGIHHDGR